MTARRAGRLITAALAATAVTAVVAMLPSVGSTAQEATHRVVEPAAVEHAATTSTRPYELYRKSSPAKPYRWLACRAIDYRIDTTGAPSGVPAVIRSTMKKIGVQTGVVFHDAGTDHRRFASTAFSHTTPTIYFSFGKDDGQGGSFADDGEVGVGGPSAAWTSYGSHDYDEAVLFGRVQLWSGWHARKTGGGVSWQSLITHEVGHTLNLAHRSARTAAMNPTLTAANPGRFSAPEVAALKQTLQTTRCDYTAFRQLAAGH